MGLDPASVAGQLAPALSDRATGDRNRLASKGWRLYWTWRSKARFGRPRLSAEVRELIAQMSRANRLWGTERIRGELLKLGLVVSNRSIRRYRWRKPRGGSQAQSWRTFLANQLQGIWAADLFVVQTIGFRTLYCSSSSATRAGN